MALPVVDIRNRVTIKVMAHNEDAAWSACAGRAPQPNTNRLVVRSIAGARSPIQPRAAVRREDNLPRLRFRTGSEDITTPSEVGTCFPNPDDDVLDPCRSNPLFLP